MKVLQPNHFDNVKYWKLGYQPFGIPKLYVNSFLVDGLLIDTGFPHISKEIVLLLENERIDKIIVTHHHEDHAGNIEALKKSLEVDAFGSAKCAQLMNNPARVEPARWLTWGQQESAHVSPLDLNQKVITDNHSFEIIEAPGHSEDQICLFEKSRGWLFSADVYLEDHIQLFMRDEKINEHINTIKKLLKLDFDVLFCSHNVQLKKGEKRLEKKLQFLEDFYGRVAQQYQRGLSEKAIMKNLKIKEYKFIKALSLGQLSRINMVRSTVRAIQNSNSK